MKQNVRVEGKICPEKSKLNQERPILRPLLTIIWAEFNTDKI